MTKSQKSRSLRPLLSGVLLRSQTDERLVALAGAGNEPAFGLIYERYRRELRSHAGRIVREDRADDVVQQAMLAAWSALLAGVEISNVRAWLHRVMHNAALDTIGRRGYNDAEIPVSSVASSCTEDLAEGRLSAASAMAALAALPEGQRQALTLTAIEGRSGHDAALEMGISESAMRQLVYRARCSVRSAATAVIPLPLINWLISAAEAPATPAAISLGAAGGGAATIAKIVAIIGVSAATLGVTHPFQTHHQSRHARHRTISQPTTIADRAAASPAPPSSHLTIRAQPASLSGPATGRPAGGMGQTASQTGQSQHGSGNPTGPQGHSGSLGRAVTNQQTAPTTAAGIQQAGAQQQRAANQNNPPGSTSTTNAPQQNNHTSTGIWTGQSGTSPPSAIPTGQTGGQNQ